MENHFIVSYCLSPTFTLHRLLKKISLSCYFMRTANKTAMMNHAILLISIWYIHFAFFKFTNLQIAVKLFTDKICKTKAISERIINSVLRFVFKHQLTHLAHKTRGGKNSETFWHFHALQKSLSPSLSPLYKTHHVFLTNSCICFNPSTGFICWTGYHVCDSRFTCIVFKRQTG